MNINSLICVEATNPILNRTSEPIDRQDISAMDTQAIIDRMIELSEGKGQGKDSRQMVGLAAVQLGVLKRVITIDVTADGSNKEQTLVPIINPEIINPSEKMVDGREGCWSCANICGNVSRHEAVTLRGYGRDGKELSLELTGFIARIAQHEVDHLGGIRFPDRIPEDEPSRLHTVLPEEFERYRTEWPTWSNLCDRSVWEALKSGETI